MFTAAVIVATLCVADAPKPAVEAKLHGEWKGGACQGMFAFKPDGTYELTRCPTLPWATHFCLRSKGPLVAGPARKQPALLLCKDALERLPNSLLDHQGRLLGDSWGGCCPFSLIDHNTAKHRQFDDVHRMLAS
jgi:hypothetical protein